MKIKPMGIMSSILFFGIPSAICGFSIYYVMQKLHRNGINDFVNFYVTMVLPLALLLLASLIAIKIEGRDFKWTTISSRFRLKRMSKLDWIYTIGLFAVMALIYVGLSFTSKWLIQFKLFTPPEFLIPAVDPRLEQNIFVDTFFGIPLKGQWWIAVVG